LNGRGRRRGWAARLLAATGVVAGLAPVLLVTAPPAWAFTAPVDITNLSSGKFAFDPKVTDINVDDKVLWRNKTNEKHTVTSDTGDFDVTLGAGGTEERRFQKAGTYAYHCKIHDGMTGTVVVQDPNAPPTTTTTAPPTTTTAPPTTTTTAPPTTTTTEPPTTTTTASRPPAGMPAPPVPASAGAQAPTTASSATTTSVPSTTTTTTAPPTTASSAPPVLAGEQPPPGPPPESSTTTGASKPGDTGDQIPTAVGPTSGDDGKLDVTAVALVSLLVAVGVFGAWTLIRVRPGRT
jgi:plastocyanin